MMTNNSIQPMRLSWRDPDGFVVNAQGSILRAVVLEKADRTRALMREPWMAELIKEGSIPATEELLFAPPGIEDPTHWLWLKHHALPFPAYPHEITALQLFDSARLTLRVATAAAARGWELKDASAWNVLHSEGRAVFVDFLSFDKLDECGRWIAYGQFVRHFLLPLLLYRKLRMAPPDIFLGNRDGISPERAYELLGAGRRMSSIALELVVLPKMLSRSGSQLIATQSQHKPKNLDPEMSRQLVLSTLRRLGRILERLAPHTGKSRTSSIWEGYEEGRQHYTDTDLVAKRDFVRKNLAAGPSVLDLGCNAGEFSLLAANCGKRVVAADADHPALSRLYAKLRAQPIPIAPLLLNVGRPTPSVGWLNSEVASFMERAAGQFDCVLMLGLLHHLLVGERMTLPMLAHLLDRLHPVQVIVEWISPNDQKFQQLAGLNAHLYSHLDETAFETSMQENFRLAEKTPLPCASRVMYDWRRL
jgi:2-polyprenyl-3-methyl-5-hydroxy-6-metoxy-1,4-benzoquinol methylase